MSNLVKNPPAGFPSSVAALVCTNFARREVKFRNASKAIFAMFSQKLDNSGMEMFEAMQVALWGMIICSILSVAERLG